mgnify:CR=1 FL=1
MIYLMNLIKLKRLMKMISSIKLIMKLVMERASVMKQDMTKRMEQPFRTYLVVLVMVRMKVVVENYIYSILPVQFTLSIFILI